MVEQAPLRDSVIEFLALATHEVLYTRRIYDEDTFEKRRSPFDVPVHVSRHPGLCEYIATHLTHVKTWFDSGVLQRLAIVVFISRVPPQAGEDVIERIVFDFEPVAANGLGAAAASAPHELLRRQLKDALVSLMASSQADRLSEEALARLAFRFEVSCYGADGAAEWITCTGACAPEAPIAPIASSLLGGVLMLNIWTAVPDLRIT